MKNLRFPYILIFIIALSGILSGCGNRGTEGEPPEIAVTNSYLQCVVKDLCGDDTEILCLAPPGMCPGHFDISPAEVNKLCKCRILLRFDFQEGIEDSLSRIKDKGLKIGSVSALRGLCVPETYVAACREVCNILSLEYPERGVQYKQRVKLIEKRLENLSDEFLTRMKHSGLGTTKVLSSDHQSQFCKWLGLAVVATFMGSDTETASNINQCLQKAKGQDVRFVMANKQEGTALAGALAERLGARMIVFSNFPDAGIGQNNFDRLLAGNVQSLLEAAK